MRRVMRERRALAQGGERERGMSLVELMVTMVITGLVAAMTAALVIGVQQTNQANTVRQDQIDTARVSVERMSKTLRASVKPNQVATCTGTDVCVADAFRGARTLSVSFYANINNPGNSIGPSRVDYAISTTGATAGQLIETVQRPVSNVPSATGYVYCTSGPGCDATKKTQVLARNVVTTSGPVFQYFDETGTPMVPVGTASLTDAQRKKVLSIEIVVRVQNGTGPDARPTTYIQRILLPNSQALMKTGST